MNGMRAEQREFLELFPWESPEQKEGFLHMLKWVKDLKIPYQLLTQQHENHLTLAFLIQKNHEAFEWWRETVADQIAQVRADLIAADERRDLRDDHVDVEIEALREVVNRLKKAIPVQW